MKKSLIIVISLFIFGCSNSKKATEVQKKDVPQKMATVTDVELKRTINYLGSDLLQGRKTGTTGISEAASYIEIQLKSFGIKPYFESFRDNFKAKGDDAYNVVGYLEGNDPKLKDEVIILGAHYDHIGIGKTVENDSIANGANDNATGTSAVLAMAKYFGVKKSNKRSLMFVLFSAEEMGLLGSKHLAKKLKAENINLYTMLNFEMVGVPFVDRDYQAFISGYEMSNLAEKMNNYSGENLIGFSELSKKYSLFKRSDNYPFYEQFKSPCHTVSSCDLSNFDFYHHVDDEPEKMNYTFMANLINKLAPVIEKMSNTPTQEIKMNE